MSIRPKVLVANRGEIAIRVMRACRELGLGTVAVYSDADADARHVWFADEAVRLGPPPTAESYLRGDKVIAAAKHTGAQLIHPGYGFLSENAEFRRACDAAGLTFVGPGAHAMEQMGTKTLARQVMHKAGVPVVPGSLEPLQNLAEAQQIAGEIGYPVMLKAAAGGGGRGIRLVHSAEEMPAAFDGAIREAVAYFKDPTVYIEKAIVRPRHIEIQVMADRHGNAVHLFDRECSVQRRNQKIIEESPAAHLSDATRLAMGQVAVQAAKAVAYEGAGTIEFLVDPQEHFFFMEMNTRLQVEHPVTELVTGTDLVVEQLRVAQGLPLSWSQEQIVQRGHAIECRIYAEDVARGFLPSPGPLHVYRPPAGPGLRVDDGFCEGDVISNHYDSMIAKLSAWAPTRDHAIARMQAALDLFEISGISHNIAHLQQVLASQAFAVGPYDTGLVKTLPALEAIPQDPELAALYAVVVAHRQAAQHQQEAAPQQESTWAYHARAQGLRGR
ncbi:MAG: acetyl-CoA carboxylase biotin carboxylase subunit [Deltaproteobacteria bacterium]|nr:acetyl-CoA carboxylase biotin carboxylase subunit [Deltaproteobacteria bacterium]